MDCEEVGSPPDLDRIESQHLRTRVLYTLPGYERLDILNRIQSPKEYELITTFQGSLSGGDIMALLKQRKGP